MSVGCSDNDENVSVERRVINPSRGLHNPGDLIVLRKERTETGDMVHGFLSVRGLRGRERFPEQYLHSKSNGPHNSGEWMAV